MKKLAVLAAVLVVVLIVGGTYLFGQKSSLRKAFLHHQERESPAVKAYYPAVGGEDVVLSERWKNYQIQAKRCPAIGEVVRVSIDKTIDGGDYVIRMEGPNAKLDKQGNQMDVCSLWLTGGEENVSLDVRDFSPY